VGSGLSTLPMLLVSLATEVLHAAKADCAFYLVQADFLFPAGRFRQDAFDQGILAKGDRLRCLKLAA